MGTPGSLRVTGGSRSGSDLPPHISSLGARCLPGGVGARLGDPAQGEAPLAHLGYSIAPARVCSLKISGLVLPLAVQDSLRLQPPPPRYLRQDPRGVQRGAQAPRPPSGEEDPLPLKVQPGVRVCRPPPLAWPASPVDCVA